jgi:hypothetical protein
MSISVGLRLDFQLSARTFMGWRVLQLGLWQGRGLLLRYQDYSEKIMQRPYQPMRGENKCSVPNVCPQCQTVVTKKTAQDKGAAGGWYAEFWARLRRPGRSISTGSK